MKIIIGVSFRQAGKVYFFDPGDEQIERGEHVIVETAKGEMCIRDRLKAMAKTLRFTIGKMMKRM